MESRDAPLEPLGYQKITPLSTPAKALTVPARCRSVMLKCETQSVRWRDDGTDPTSSDGFLLDSGEEFFYTGKVAKLRFLEVTAGAVLHVNYYA
jgi:hypothetical protein